MGKWGEKPQIFENVSTWCFAGAVLPAARGLVRCLGRGFVAQGSVAGLHGRFAGEAAGRPIEHGLVARVAGALVVLLALPAHLGSPCQRCVHPQ